MFDILVSLGAKMNILNRQGLTPLTLAAKLSIKEVMCIQNLSTTLHFRSVCALSDRLRTAALHSSLAHAIPMRNTTRALCALLLCFGLAAGCGSDDATDLDPRAVA